MTSRSGIIRAFYVRPALVAICSGWITSGVRSTPRTRRTHGFFLWVPFVSLCDDQRCIMWRHDASSRGDADDGGVHGAGVGGSIGVGPAVASGRAGPAGGRVAL